MQRTSSGYAFPAGYSTKSKLDRLSRVFGVRGLSTLLDVQYPRLRRYARQKDIKDPELVRRISELDYVVDCALQIMNPEDVHPWLVAPEALLGGHVPINVLLRSGAARVMGALESMRGGSMA